MSNKILIEVRNLSRFYGARCAIEDISFSVNRGEISGFLGPNGAGKSTLMQIICGVLAATSGSVSIAGHDILEDPVPAKRQLGYLPEQPPLYPDCTVDEYLYYCARLRGIKRSQVSGSVDISKQKCGLDGFGRRLIGNLSKGYQQRVGIAQALIHTPAVIVLDEPSSGLDPNQIIEIRELIRDMGRDHSIILSTHIMAEAQNICDRVLIMHQGRVVLDKELGSLQGTGDQQYIIVAFNEPPASLDQLYSLDGVTNIHALGNNRFRISCRNDPSLASVIAGTAAANRWGLCELVAESESLEQTYLKLTRATAGDDNGA